MGSSCRLVDGADDAFRRCDALVKRLKGTASRGRREAEGYDDVNTFEHVVQVLVRYIPGMNPDQAWKLAHQIDGEGAAVVWSGPQEQGELYHQQLSAEGLTMAPLDFS